SEATPILTGSLVLLALGMGYVLTGAELAAWWVTAPVLIVVIGAAVFEVGAFGDLISGHGVGGIIPEWARWVSRALALALLAVALFVFFRDRRRPRPDHRMRLAVLLINSALIGGYLLVIFFSVPQVGGLSLGGTTASQLMIDFAILVNPLLQVAAVDFGEWGQLLGERAVEASGRLRRNATAVGALAASGGLLVWGILKAPPYGMRTLGYPALMLVGIGIVALVIGRLLRLNHRRWHEPFNYLSLLAVSGLVLLVVAAVSLATVSKISASPARDRFGLADPSGQFLASSGASAQRILRGPLEYTILIPEGMFKTSRGDITAFTNYEAGAGNTPRILDQVVVTVTSGAVDQSALAGLGADPTETSSHGAWTVAPVASGDRAGFAAEQTYRKDGQTVGALILATAPTSEVQAELPVLMAFLNSFRPGDQPVASVRADESTVDYTPVWGRVIVTNLVISAVLLLIVAIGRKRLPQRVVSGLVLFPFVSLMTLVLFDNYFGAYLTGRGSDWPYVGESGLYFALGLFGVVVVGATLAPGRRRTEPAFRAQKAVLAFEVAVIVLALMDILYGHAISASRAAVAAAVILLAALTWEIATSGQSLLNRGSSALPRTSRVLLFSGYVVLVAAAIIFFTGQRSTSTGAVVESAFEPDSVTQAALFR